MNVDIKQWGNVGGRWLLLILAVVAAFVLIEYAVHPRRQARPQAKALAAIMGYGLVVFLVCIMRWSPLQPLLAPLFDEVMVMAAIAKTGKSPDNPEAQVDPMVRAGAMVGCGVYGGITFSAVVVAGAMLAGVSH